MRLAILHTSPATIGLFGPMIRAERPDVTVANWLDDTILPELAANGADIAAIRPRWTHYARIARDGGADLILNACSSIGELCEPVAAEIGTEIVRVDSAMARAVAAAGKPVTVMATLSTTLGPTTAALRRAAAEAGTDAEVRSVLVEGAYKALMDGRQDEHDRLIAEAIAGAGRSDGAIVLAQASMARVLPAVDPGIASRCVTSPPFAVRAVLDAIDARIGKSADR